MKNAVPFKIYNATELAELSEALHQRLRAWKEGWLGEVEMEINIFNAFEDILPKQFHVGGSLNGKIQLLDGGCGFLLISEETKSMLIENILGLSGGVGGGATCVATTRLFSQFIGALFGAMNFSAQALSAVNARPLSVEEFRRFFEKQTWKIRGKGWLYLALNLADVTLPVLLTPENILSDARDPVQRQPHRFGRGMDSIADNKVKIVAELGTVSLSIGDFRSLRSGDILRLNAQFSDKATVKTAGGELICKGFLGKNANKRAIKITG